MLAHTSTLDSALDSAMDAATATAPSLILTLLTLCIASLGPTDGFVNYALDRCVFNTNDLGSVEYINSYFYERKEVVRFNSTVGHYMGFTEFGVYNAKLWNEDPAQLAARRAQRETYCKNHAENAYNAVLKYSAEPYVRLYSESPSGVKHSAMLVCSVYDFYPKRIKVSWLRDGQEVTSDVTSTQVLADADWYYQLHSHLEYTPRSGEKITCVVEHVSLKTPLHTDWDPSLPESERNKIAIGASGLVLGLILSLAGFIYYKRKAQGRILVPTTN